MKTKYNVKEGYIRRTFDLSKVSKRQSNIYKYKKSEAYLGMMLFHKLLSLGVESIPEFLDGRNRYDFIILSRGSVNPVCIVEVKKSRGRVDMAQIAKYERNSFNIPVLVLAGADDFEDTFNRILTLLGLESTFPAT